MAARRARKALLAELLACASTLSDQVSAPTKYLGTDHPAVRYLESSAGLALTPALLGPADRVKLAHAEADLIAGVIVAVLDGLGLSDQDWERGTQLALDALMAASAEGWSPL